MKKKFEWMLAIEEAKTSGHFLDEFKKFSATWHLCAVGDKICKENVTIWNALKRDKVYPKSVLTQNAYDLGIRFQAAVLTDNAVEAAKVLSEINKLPKVLSVSDLSEIPL